MIAAHLDDQQTKEAMKPIGVATPMPATGGGFTMATFRGVDVPDGTDLYSASQLSNLRRSHAELVEALEEHRAAHEAMFPGASMYASLEEGIKGQRAWAERQDAADKAADAALQQAKELLSPLPEGSTTERKA